MAKFWQAVFLLIIALLVLPECWAGKRTRVQANPQLSEDVPPARRPITRSTELPEGYLDEIFQTQLNTSVINKYLQARNQFLAKLDLELVLTTADGSCQFDALGQQLPEPQHGHKLRDYLLAEAEKVEKRYKAKNHIDDREKIFWDYFRTVLYPAGMDALKNEFINPRIWFDSLSLTPLAAFLLKRPVIHLKPSLREPWYDIQAVNGDGKILDEGEWQTLLPLNPLFLVNNGGGHYEGALPKVTGKVAIHSAPVKVEWESDLEDVLLLGVSDEELNQFSETATQEEAGAVELDEPYDELSPEPLEYGDPVLEFGLQPADVNDWLLSVKPVPKTYQELSELIGKYKLQMGGGGIPEMAGGLFGALALAFYRHGVMEKPILHDVRFLNETRTLLERLQYQPLLGPVIHEALGFCRSSVTDSDSHVLGQALQDINDELSPPWAKPCFLTALSSVHNTPLMLMHPYAKDDKALLYQPWQPVVEVPVDQLPVVIEQVRPAVLVHNGGEGEAVRWTTVVYPSKAFSPFRQKSPFEPVDASETPPARHLAYGMTMVLVPLMRKLPTVALKNLMALPDGLLPVGHKEYLDACLSLRGRPSDKQMDETQKKVCKMAGIEMGNEWQAAWRILEAYILKKKKMYGQADRMLRNLAEEEETPQYLRRYILDMRAFTAFFDEESPRMALQMLGQYQNMIDSSRRLLLLQAGALRGAQTDLDKNISILKNLYDGNPYDLDATLSLAIMYSTINRDREAITLLNRIPGYRDIHEAVRALASSYSHNRQIREALNLMYPLCTTQVNEKNISVLLSILGDARDTTLLKGSLAIIDHIKSQGFSDKKHLANSRSAIQVSLGLYSEARKTLHSVYDDEKVFRELKREAFYRSKCGEYGHSAGLCREALEFDPRSIDLLSLLTMVLEKSQRINTARDVYVENYWLVIRNMKLAANAMVFLENNRDQIPAFFQHGNIPECPLCYIWYSFTEKDRRNDQKLSRIFSQHLQNVKVKQLYHPFYRKRSDIELHDAESYRAGWAVRNHQGRHPHHYQRQYHNNQPRMKPPHRTAHRHQRVLPGGRMPTHSTHFPYYPVSPRYPDHPDYSRRPSGPHHHYPAPHSAHRKW